MSLASMSTPRELGSKHDGGAGAPSLLGRGPRPFWVGTSWKMNKTLSEARAYCGLLRDAAPPSMEIFVIPPHTSLAVVADCLAATPIRVGAQDGHWDDSGALTGAVSVAMAKDAGAAILEIGHSERRISFGETDSQVNAKVHAALRHGLIPLVCVGDTREERNAGAALESVVRQAKLALAGVSSADLSHCLIAYEPVWAIGAEGVAADPGTVETAHRALRRAILEHAAGDVAILYGGSIDADNASSYAELEEVDGLFVGRAALVAENFLRIASIAAGIRSETARSAVS